MAGIIATIIAARKRHYTFAWIIGIWTGIAIILAFSGMVSIAIAPGWIFLFIALGMKKIPKEGEDLSVSGGSNTSILSDNNQVSENASPTAIAPVGQTVAYIDDAVPVERSSPTPVAIRFCRYCGQELEPGTKFCRHCGAKLD